MADLAIRAATLCVLIGGVHTAQEFCNRSTQYELNGLCCDQCPPGHFRSAWCTADSPTGCQPCPEGTFNSEYNIYPRCEYCTRCIPGLHQVEMEKCTPTRNTRCGCEKDENITKLAKQGTLFWCCPKCPAGMETLNECSLTDFVTTCSPCPPGTFSDHPGSRCRDCTRCERELYPCTNASDTVCSGSSKVTTCTDCPPGTFRDRPGSRCRDCTRCERELSPCTNASDAVCSGPDVSANEVYAATAAVATCIIPVIALLVVVTVRLCRRVSDEENDAPPSDSSSMETFSTQGSLATLQRSDELQSMLNACNNIVNSSRECVCSGNEPIDKRISALLSDPSSSL